MDPVVRPARVQGEATCDIAWRRWLATEPFGEMAVQDWLPASARLVVVAPHPDDEILASGGLISTHAAQGGRVLIVAVTDGEASHNESPSSNGHDVAAIRRNERWLGLRQLGLSKPTVLALALKDGKVQHQADVLLERLMALLHRSDIVVSTWEHDGHPDHETTGYMARLACANVGCTFLAAPVWMWHWASPGDARIPWHRLRGMPLRAQDRARKQAALAAHQSQLAPRSDSLGAVLGDAIVQRAAWPIEYYFA